MNSSSDICGNEELTPNHFYLSTLSGQNRWDYIVRHRSIFRGHILETLVARVHSNINSEKKDRKRQMSKRTSDLVLILDENLDRN